MASDNEATHGEKVFQHEGTQLRTAGGLTVTDIHEAQVQAPASGREAGSTKALPASTRLIYTTLLFCVRVNEPRRDSSKISRSCCVSLPTEEHDARQLGQTHHTEERHRPEEMDRGERTIALHGVLLGTAGEVTVARARCRAAARNLASLRLFIEAGPRARPPLARQVVGTHVARFARPSQGSAQTALRRAIVDCAEEKAAYDVDVALGLFDQGHVRALLEHGELRAQDA